jgi:hypothetical protein
MPRWSHDLFRPPARQAVRRTAATMIACVLCRAHRGQPGHADINSAYAGDVSSKSMSYEDARHADATKIIIGVIDAFVPSKR